MTATYTLVEWPSADLSALPIGPPRQRGQNKLYIIAILFLLALALTWLILENRRKERKSPWA
ncbi:hypothetical protein TH61_05575 [Rufibacter sp. DG15C]|nr:hypothetical protein TH61_05575 [Rufibacter sp. DG15C]